MPFDATHANGEPVMTEDERRALYSLVRQIDGEKGEWFSRMVRESIKQSKRARSLKWQHGQE